MEHNFFFSPQKNLSQPKFQKEKVFFHELQFYRIAGINNNKMKLGLCDFCEFNNEELLLVQISIS